MPNPLLQTPPFLDPATMQSPADASANAADGTIAAPPQDNSVNFANLLAQMRGPQGQVKAAAPTNPTQDFIDRTATKSQADILKERLGMDDASVTKRKADGKSEFAHTLKMMAGGLLGANYTGDAKTAFNNNQEQVKTAVNELRNQQLAQAAQAKVDEAAALRESNEKLKTEANSTKKYLADIAQQKADQEAEKTANTAAYQKEHNRIALLKQEADQGNGVALQEYHKSIEALAEKKYGAEPKDIIADQNRAKNPDGSFNPKGQIDMSGYMADMDRYNKSLQLKNRPYAPALIQGADVPSFDPTTGQQTGSSKTVTAVNRLTGQPINTPQTVGTATFGPTASGAVNLPKSQGETATRNRQSAILSNQMAQSLLNDYGAGKTDDYTGLLKGNKYAQMARNEIPGAVSSGEAFQQLMGPDAMITHIKGLTGGRMNQMELGMVGKSAGGQVSDGEALTRRAMIYNLSRDFQAKDAMMQMPPGVAQSPEFTEAIKSTVDKAISDAKKNGKSGMLTKTPSIMDVVEQAKKNAINKAKTAAGPMPTDKLEKYKNDLGIK